EQRAGDGVALGWRGLRVDLHPRRRGDLLHLAEQLAQLPVFFGEVSQRRALLSALPLFRVPLDYLLGDLLGGGFDLLERPCFARDALALVGRSAPFALRAEAATPAAVELGEGAGGALTGETLGVSG